MAVLLPDNIEIVIGSGWTGKVFFSEDDVIILKRVGANAGRFSEDGTNTPDSSTNRMRVLFDSGSDPTWTDITVEVHCPTSVETATFYEAFTIFTYFGPGTTQGGDGIYHLRDLWLLPSIDANDVGYGMVTGAAFYNPNIFKSMQIWPPTITLKGLTGNKVIIGG